MKRTPVYVCTFILIACAPLHASAQSTAQLKSENADLRAQLAALQAQGCVAPPGPGTSPEWRDAQLSARVASIRVGLQRNSRVTYDATVSITLTNTGNAPLALNYEQGTFSLTDNHGYQYELQTYSPAKFVKGIPIANGRTASTHQPLMPGQSSTVTFITDRQMSNGQTPGNRFDISATFGAYQDEGQGRIRKLQMFPVTFTDVARSSSGFDGGQTGTSQPAEVGGKVIDRLLDGLLKGGR